MYNIANLIINLEKKIEENAGGGGSVISIEVIDNSHLLSQEGITLSKTKTITEDCWLLAEIGGMASNVSFKINNTERLFIDGYYFQDHEMIPVYVGDEIALTVAADGSNDNLISTILLISGIDVPEKPTN